MTTSLPTQTPPPRAHWLYPAIIIILGAAVYAKAIPTPFVFDDKDYLLDNSTLRTPAAPTRALPPYPAKGYLDDNTRPILFLTFATNFALSKYNPWSYHVFNIFIHLAAGLTLFGILRRVLSLPSLYEHFGGSTNFLAFAIALIWTVHPVNTMAVTYTWQRCESLMGLFYLLTIFCFTHAATTNSRPNFWYAGAVISCFLGMGTKEVMVSAPLFLLLWDRALFAGTFRAALKKRALVHISLFSTLGILAYLIKTQSAFHENPGVGFTSLTNSWQYLITMPGVYLTYLRLAIWPSPLCIDYLWSPTVQFADTIPYLIPVGGIIAATGWAFFKHPAWSLPGCFFFLVFAPTSSVMPMPDALVEYRFYLPLIALLTAICSGVFILIQPYLRRGTASPAAGAMTAMINPRQRASVLIVCAIAILFGSLTVQRNATYRSDILLWDDVVQQYPDNSRARYNLANALNAKGNETNDQKLFAAAQMQYEAGVTLAPEAVHMLMNMGENLIRLGRLPEAREAFRRAANFAPENDLALYNFGAILLALNEPTAARIQLERAQNLSPKNSKIQHKLTEACLRLDDIPAAIRHGEAAVRLNPNFASAHFALGFAYEQSHRHADAIRHYQQALKLNPTHPTAQSRLKTLLTRSP